MNYNRRSLMFTALLASVPVGAIFAQSSIPAKQSDELSRERKRFHQFVQQRKFDDAEKAIAVLSTYRSSPELDRDQAELAVAMQDYPSTLRHLTTFFEGVPGAKQRFVGGYEPVRAWYWFLLHQNGKTEAANKVFDDLLKSPVRAPKGRAFLNPRELSSNKLAQTHMYMAGYYFAHRNFDRSDRSIALAKMVDPKVKVDPSFISESKLHDMRSMRDAKEAEEQFAILDHTAYAKKVGKQVLF